MSGLRAFLADNTGSPAVEMVLVLPIVMALLFGSVELGYYFYAEHQVVKGVRDGARFGSRQSFVDLNCTGNTPSSVPSGVETAIQEITRTGQISGGTARIPGWVNEDIDVSVTCPGTAVTTGIYEGSDNAPQINVAASVAYPSLFDSLGFIDLTYTLNASQQAAVMGL